MGSVIFSQIRHCPSASCIWSCRGFLGRWHRSLLLPLWRNSRCALSFLRQRTFTSWVFFVLSCVLGKATISLLKKINLTILLFFASWKSVDYVSFIFDNIDRRPQSLKNHLCMGPKNSYRSTLQGFGALHCFWYAWQFFAHCHGLLVKVESLCLDAGFRRITADLD